MKILYAGSVDLSAQRGDSLHFLQLARALSMRGHQLDVVALNKPADSLPQGLTLFPITRSSTPKIYHFLNDLRLLWKIFRLTTLFRYDIFYQRGIPLANRVLRMHGIPSVLEVNGIQIDELRSRGLSRLALSLYERREAATLKDAAHYICVTEGIRDRLVSYYAIDREACSVIPNAADTDLFQPLDRLSCQQTRGLQSDQLQLGFVGSFQPWVDFETLFSALCILRDKGVPLHCTLVGDGQLETQVEQQVQEYNLPGIVGFAGRLPHSEIPKWINAFDLCLAPFRRERNEVIGLSPLKLYEYLACQRPVVAADLSGLREDIGISQAGKIYAPEDPESLAREIEWLFHHPEICEEMGIRGRDFVLRDHSWASAASRTENIIDLVKSL